MKDIFTTSNRAAADEVLLPGFPDVTQITEMQTGNLLDLLGVGFCAVRENGIVQSFNRTAADLLQLGSSIITGEELRDIQTLLPPDLTAVVFQSIDKATPWNGDYFFPATKKWAEIRLRPAGGGMQLFLRDITEVTLLYRLDLLEKNVLEWNADESRPLIDVISFLLDGIRSIHQHMYCTVLKAADGRLFTWASTHLPSRYNDMVNGTPVGPASGSCGTAAYLMDRVIVSDILTDPKWENYKHMAIPFGLRGCVSQPFFDAGNKLLGTFAIYFKTPGLPDEQELRTISKAKELLETMIQNRMSREKVTHSETSLREAQAIAHLGSWQMEFSDKTTYWSEEMYHILGLAIGEISPSIASIISMVHPEDQALIAAMLYSGENMRKKNSQQYRVVRKSGEVRHVYSEWRYEFNEGGEPTRIVGIMQDITDKVEAGMALQQSEEKYRSLFDSSPLPIWVYDTGDFRFLDVNRAAIAQYGYSRGEFLQMTIIDIRPVEDREAFKTHLEGIRNSSGPQQGNFRHMKKSGEIIDVYIQGSMVSFDSRPARLVQAVDITDNIRHLHAIERQNEQLREIAWLQSHVVRTPVSQMLSMIELCEQAGLTEEERRQAWLYLKEAAQKLDEIVHEIVTKTAKVNL